MDPELDWEQMKARLAAINAARQPLTRQEILTDMAGNPVRPREGFLPVSVHNYQELTTAVRGGPLDWVTPLDKEVPAAASPMIAGPIPAAIAAAAKKLNDALLRQMNEMDAIVARQPSFDGEPPVKRREYIVDLDAACRRETAIGRFKPTLAPKEPSPLPANLFGKMARTRERRVAGYAHYGIDE